MTIKTEFAVSMSCQACVDDVHRVLEKEPGVTSVRVDLNEQRVVVEGQAAPSRLARLLRDTGRTVVVRGMGSANGQRSAAAVCIFELYTPPGATQPVATDRGNDQPRGLARLIQVTEDLCLIDVTVQGLSPGKHAIAVHENGNISQGAASCGGHYNPHGVAHGEPDHGRGMEVPGHVGDLGNITVDENGWGDMLIETRRFAVWDVIGRSMVIAHGEDDLGRGTEPASKINGNAGQGALCGVIARSAGVFENTKRICACDGRTLWEEARLKSHNL